MHNTLIYDVQQDNKINFKNWLDRFWSNQDVLYHYTADLHGIGNRTVVM